MIGTHTHVLLREMLNHHSARSATLAIVLDLELQTSSGEERITGTSFASPAARSTLYNPEEILEIDTTQRSDDRGAAIFKSAFSSSVDDIATFFSNVAAG